MVLSKWESKLRRVARTGATNLPPSADAYVHQQQPVVENHAVGKILSVITYCGVEVTCRVTNVKEDTAGVIYEAVPVGNKKSRELRTAGVPVDDDTVNHKFIVFPHQVVQ